MNTAFSNHLYLEPIQAIRDTAKAQQQVIVAQGNQLRALFDNARRMQDALSTSARRTFLFKFENDVLPLVDDYASLSKDMDTAIKQIRDVASNCINLPYQVREDVLKMVRECEVGYVQNKEEISRVVADTNAVLVKMQEV